MKKVFFASAAILLAVISTQAQPADAIAKNDNGQERKEFMKEKKGKEVSYQSKQEFFRNFGDKTGVQWRRTSSYDEADFTKDGAATTAYYDFDSRLVGTTSLKTFADLPAAGQKQIGKEYRDYTVKAVVFYDDNEQNETNIVLYGNQFDGEDNYFVELQKDNKEIVVQVTTDGLVGYFTER